MPLGRSKTGRTLGEHGIFGDEEAADLRSILDQLQSQVTELTIQVHSQFTTIAAHAEIARQQADFARDEARADLDRTRDLLIGLIEQVRAASLADVEHHRAGSAPGPSVSVQNERLAEIEQQVQMLTAAAEQSFNRQRELADTMAALLDTVFAERRGEPVSGLALI